MGIFSDEELVQIAMVLDEEMEEVEEQINLGRDKPCGMIQNLLLIAFIVLPNLGGIVVGLITVANLPWYEKLKKPSWRLPNWAFGPIWAAIYSLIGYSSYLIFKAGDWTKDPVQTALLVYGVDLLVNWLWSPILFGVKNLKLALYDILLLDAITVANAFLFYQINSTAGLLYIPYLIWLVLATALNYEISRDNPDTQGVKDAESTTVHLGQPCHHHQPHTSPNINPCNHCQPQVTLATPHSHYHNRIE